MPAYDLRKDKVSKRKVFGVGINDVPGGSTHKAYQSWRDMLERCYGESFRKANPIQADSTICEEWLTFSVYLAWYTANVGERDFINRKESHFGPDDVIVGRRIPPNAKRDDTGKRVAARKTSKDLLMTVNGVEVTVADAMRRMLKDGQTLQQIFQR